MRRRAYRACAHLPVAGRVARRPSAGVVHAERRRAPPARRVPLTMTNTPFGFALPGGRAAQTRTIRRRCRRSWRSCSRCSPTRAPARSTGIWPGRWPSPSSRDDPAVATPQKAAVEEALRLADLWLEPESSLPSGIRSVEAWRRADWLTKTLDVWRKLCDPVAARMTGAMGDLVPEEMRAQLGPMAAMLHLARWRRVRRPARQGARLARRRGALRRRHRAAARPGRHGRAHPGQHRGVRRGPGDPRGPGPALRGPARGRPPAAVRARAVAARRTCSSAVESYAARHQGRPRGDRGGDGPHRPDRPRVDARRSRSRASSPRRTPRSRRPRWPGWRPRSPWSRAGSATWWTAPAPTGCPTPVRLAETFRRRRAAGGPAEQTFAALVGLELRPRRLREAAALWAALTEHRGIDGRDAALGPPGPAAQRRRLRRPARPSPGPAATADHRPRLPAPSSTDGPTTPSPDRPADDQRPGRVWSQRMATRRRGLAGTAVRPRASGSARRPAEAGRGWRPSPRGAGPGGPDQPGPQPVPARRGATSSGCGASRAALRVWPVQAQRRQPGRRGQRTRRGRAARLAADRRGRRDRSAGQRAQQLGDHEAGQVGRVGARAGPPGRTRPPAAAASTVGSVQLRHHVPAQSRASPPAEQSASSARYRDRRLHLGHQSRGRPARPRRAPAASAGVTPAGSTAAAASTAMATRRGTPTTTRRVIPAHARLRVRPPHPTRSGAPRRRLDDMIDRLPKSQCAGDLA